MKEKQIEIKRQKESKYLEIKAQRDLAAKKKRKQEMLFLGKIHNCYHREKEEKEKKKRDCDELIAKLEQEEQKMIE